MKLGLGADPAVMRVSIHKSAGLIGAWDWSNFYPLKWAENMTEVRY